MPVGQPQYLWDLYMYLVYHTPHVANVSGFYICYCIYCYFNYTTVLHFKLWHSIYDCLQSHVRLGFSVIEISTFRQKRNDKNPWVTSTHLSLKYICDSCYMHFVSLNIYVTAVTNFCQKQKSVYRKILKFGLTIRWKLINRNDLEINSE